MTNQLDPLPRRFTRAGCEHVLEVLVADGSGRRVVGKEYYVQRQLLAPVLQGHVKSLLAVLVDDHITPRLYNRVDLNLVAMLMGAQP